MNAHTTDKPEPEYRIVKVEASQFYSCPVRNVSTYGGECNHPDRPGTTRQDRCEDRLPPWCPLRDRPLLVKLEE